MGKRKQPVMSVEELMADCAASDESDSSGTETGDVTNKTEQEHVNVGRKQAAKKHKQSLENLKDQDPEFYEFLRKEDKELLSFNPDEVQDSEDDSSSDDSDDNKSSYKPPKKLEVATDSEEDDSETEVKATVKDKSKKKVQVTMKMIRKWSESLKEHNSLQALHQCVSAFKSAVQDAGSDEAKSMSKYKVEGSLVFNAIVRLCIMDVVPMLNRFLKLPEKNKDSRKPALPSNSDKWKRVKVDVKSYLTDLLQLLSQMSESVILNVILKHVHQLVTYYVSFPKLMKILLKKLIAVWGTGEETSRVLAFLSIIKLTRITQDSMLEYVLKQMYMSYVQNCKFTSPNTLPLINFMQRSLVEMFSIDLALTYQYAFIYIRQLAIHLRNAITVKKKETCQAVYNWQYIHSLHMWARLLSQLYPNETLEPLIYPLTQVIIGTIKLDPTSRYYPLRFHCIRTLNMLSDSTNTFIPTLPFVTEIFQLTDFNKKHKGASFKPFNFACILKMSKSQLQEKAFKDGIIDEIYDLLLECFAIHSHSIGFPELALPSVIQIKEFLKTCKIANYTKLIKQILDKVQDTSNTITKKRRSSGLQLNNTKGIEAWERNLKTEGTTLSKHYTQYKKKRAIELQHEIAGKERISSENLPTIERRPILGKATAKERKEFKGLFESDSDVDSSDEDDNRFLLKEERPKKKRKVEKTSDDSDQYSDFDDDELEALNRSASEEESEDEEEDEENESGKNPNNESENDEEMDSDISDHGDIVEDFELTDSDESSSD